MTTVDVPAPGRMLDLLSGFVHELRAAGLPVSMTENLDAMRALEHIPIEDRATFKTALQTEAQLRSCASQAANER